MSASFNHCTLLGNLVRDPDVRFTPQGVQVVDVSIALNHTWKDESGTKREDVTYVNIVFWSKLADIAGKYLKKGQPVLISGRLQQDRWEDKTGQKHSRLRIVADNLQLLGSRDSDSGPASSTSHQAPQRQPAAPTPRPAPSAAARPAPAPKPRPTPDPDLDGMPEEDSIPF
jgi:single-strand DNA-binding protein